MFAESLLESGNTHPKGRGWATALSISIQTLLLAALVALPIFRPDKLLLEPKPITAPIAFGVPDVQPERPPRPAAGNQPPVERDNVIRAPQDIPNSDPRDFVRDTLSGPAPAPCVAGCSSPAGSDIGVPSAQPPTVAPPATPPVRPAPRPVVSVLQLGGLIHQVQPVYPRNAVNIRLEGTVIMRALVDREGRITALQVLSGHPFFVNAARDAVSQWRYRPYLLNGQPVEVETQITVNFKLSR